MNVGVASLWAVLMTLQATALEFMPGEGPTVEIALRTAWVAPAGAPRLVDGEIPPWSPRLVVPFDGTVATDMARQRVLARSGSAAAWAALAAAHYREGRYEAAWSAARQMRMAAAALDIPLSLAASAFYDKCRRAAEALSLSE